MGGACSMRGADEFIQNLSWKFEGKRPLGRLRPSRKIILKRRSVGGVDWIDLAQVSDRWRAFVNLLVL